MSFSSEQLLAFTTAYELRSFSKAASKLRKHRSTIGQLVSALEDQLAVSLFNRVGYSLQPTHQGEILYLYARHAIEKMRILEKVALRLALGELEELNLAYDPFTPPAVLLKTRQVLGLKYPNLTVNMVAMTKSDVQKHLLEGSVHMAFVNIYHATAINSIESVLLGYLSFFPVVAKTNPITGLKPSQTFLELQSRKQLVLESLVEESMSERIIYSSDYECIDQVSLIVHLLQNGQCWSLLPKHVCTDNNGSLSEVHVNESIKPIKVPMALWCQPLAQIQSFKQELLSELGQFFE